jgi:hypothetical protein
VSTEDSPKTPSTVTLNYIKSNFFRVVHVDGAMGGFTPRGQLFFSLYHERPPLPDVTVQAIENGQLGPEIVEQRKGSQGILREIEFGAVMDVAVAKSIVDWLEQRIKIMEQLQSDMLAKEGVKV